MGRTRYENRAITTTGGWPSSAYPRGLLVLSGHDHNCERVEPQYGVTYVVSGGGCKTTAVGRSRWRCCRWLDPCLLLGVPDVPCSRSTCQRAPTEALGASNTG